MKETRMTDRTAMLPSGSHTRLEWSAVIKTALILIGVLVAGPLTSERASAVITEVFKVTSLTTPSDPSTYAGIGYVFTTTQTLTISAFGLFDHNGTSIPGTDVPISLYYSNNLATNGGAWVGGGGHNSGDLLLSSAVSSADPIYSLSGGGYTLGTDGFRYRDLASNLTLLPGTYEIVYRDAAAVPPWGSGATFTTVPGVTWNESVYNASVGSPGTAVYAINSIFTAGAYFGPNLEIAPEPASAGLLIAGGTLLLRRRRV